jgi:anti-sigma factor RsiW
MKSVRDDDTPCSVLAPVLTALLDGELAPDQRGRVEQHLARCAACATLVAQQRAARAAVRSAKRMRAPAALHARVLADLDRAERAVRRRHQLMIAGGVAAVVVLCAAVGLARFQQGSPGVSLVERAVDSHLSGTLGSTPVMVRASDAGVVAAWLQTATGRTIEVPAFDDDGYRLVGARTDPSVAPGAVSLVYEGGDRLTCIVIAGRISFAAEFVVSSVSPNLHVARRQDASIAAWQDADTTYLLIGARDAAVLERLAQAAESRE